MTRKINCDWEKQELADLNRRIEILWEAAGGLCIFCARKEKITGTMHTIKDCPDLVQDHPCPAYGLRQLISELTTTIKNQKENL